MADTEAMQALRDTINAADATHESNYTNPDTILALTKTVKSGNITLTDWNSMTQAIADSRGDVDSLYTINAPLLATLEDLYDTKEYLSNKVTSLHAPSYYHSDNSYPSAKAVATWVAANIDDIKNTSYTFTNPKYFSTRSARRNNEVLEYSDDIKLDFDGYGISLYPKTQSNSFKSRYYTTRLFADGVITINFNDNTGTYTESEFSITSVQYNNWAFRHKRGGSTYYANLPDISGNIAIIENSTGAIIIPNFDSYGNQIGTKRIKCINGVLTVID